MSRNTQYKRLFKQIFKDINDLTDQTSFKCTCLFISNESDIESDIDCDCEDELLDVEDEITELVGWIKELECRSKYMEMTLLNLHNIELDSVKIHVCEWCLKNSLENPEMEFVKCKKCQKNVCSLCMSDKFNFHCCKKSKKNIKTQHRSHEDADVTNYLKYNDIKTELDFIKRKITYLIMCIRFAESLTYNDVYELENVEQILYDIENGFEYFERTIRGIKGMTVDSKKVIVCEWCLGNSLLSPDIKVNECKKCKKTICSDCTNHRLTFCDICQSYVCTENCMDQSIVENQTNISFCSISCAKNLFNAKTSLIFPQDIQQVILTFVLGPKIVTTKRHRSK